MKRDKEYRSIELISAGSEEMIVTGSIKYNVPSLDMGFTEMIAPSAFRKTLADGYDVRAYYSHDESKVLGRVKNGSLQLNNTEEGLDFTITLPNTQEGRDVYELVKTGYVTGVSFGFICMNDRIEIRDGVEYRIVTEAKLMEITLCSEPAYEQNQCQARSLSEALKNKENIDEADLAAINEEIEKLKGLLPEVQEKQLEEATDPEPEQPATAEETNQPDPDEDALNELMERFNKIEEKLKRNFRYGLI